MNSKRGVSAVVATVLIILITVAAVVIIWAAIIPMINSNLEFTEFNGRLVVLTSNGYTTYDSVNDKISVQIKNENSDNIDLAKIIVHTDLGETFSERVDAPGKNQVRTYYFKNLSWYIKGIPIRVGVAPIYVGSNFEKEGPEASLVDFGVGSIDEEGEEWGNESYVTEWRFRGGSSGSGNGETGGGDTSGGDGVTGSSEVCLVDLDCGEPYYSEIPQCVVDRVYRNLITPVCSLNGNNPNSCDEISESQPVEVCLDLCFNGACVSPTSQGMCSFGSDCGLPFNNTDYSCVNGNVSVTQSTPICIGSSPNKVCDIVNNSVLYMDCGGRGCVDGVCLLSEFDTCTLDNHCGLPYNSSDFCVGSNVYRNVNTPLCVGNPRSCDVLTNSILVENCDFSCVSGECVIPEENQDDYLVAYWAFEEGNGAVVGDLSRNSYTAYVPPGVQWSSGANLSDYSLFFNGIDGFARVLGDSPFLGITDDLTLESWVYPTDISGLRTIITDWNDESPYLGLNQGKIAFNPGLISILSNSEVPINSWTKIRITYDGSNINFYINDILDKSEPYVGLIGQSNKELYLGRLGDTPNYFFKGRIDEVKIWNKSFAP